MEEKDLNSERINMESLVNARFNYLLVVFTIIVTGLTTSKSYLQFKIVILFGVFLTLAIGWTLLRAQLKQSILFGEIRKRHLDHPAAFADEKSRRTEWWHWLDPRRYSTQRIIGYLFPLAIPFVLLVAFHYRGKLYSQNKVEEKAAALEEKTGALAEQLSKDESEIQYLHKSVDILGGRIIALETDLRNAATRIAAPRATKKKRKQR
jgi:hypothetical protein